MKRRLSALAALLTLLTGCGVSDTGPEPAGAVASGLERTGKREHFTRLYFIGVNGNQAVARRTDGPAGPAQAVRMLVEGPTEAERQRGLITQVPDMSADLRVSAREGVVDLHLPVVIASGDLGTMALSQLVCTAAHADLPGNVAPDDVEVRVYELSESDPFPVRCNRFNIAQPAGVSTKD
ncbi:hypothetical protein [Streptomyces sp. N35]|uniref:hypothetical protein n=1 Tax=Streptomyces sp. N35 TaxID=2795730 RepID=UPI0027DE21C0|nr:hypothetical protein [Streptomyces sp. N35]